MSTFTITLAGDATPVEINMPGSVSATAAAASASAAASSESLARLYAISDTDAAITGADETTDRGAKFYAEKAATDGAAQVTLAAAQVALAEGFADEAASVSRLTQVGATAVVTTTSYGSTVPDTSNAINRGWSNGIPFPADSLPHEVTVRLSAAATFDAWIVDGVTGVLLKKSTVPLVYAGAGVDTQPISDGFGSYIAPANSLLFLRRTAGTGALRVDSGVTSQAIAVPSADASEGDTLTFSVVDDSRVAISYSIRSVADAVSPRVSDLEAAMPALEKDEITLGFLLQSGAVDSVSGDTLASLCPAVPIYSDVLITKALAHYREPGVTFVEFWSQTKLGKVQLERRTSFTTAAGQNEFTLPGGGWRTGGAGFLVFRTITGPNPSFTTASVGFWSIAKSNPAEIGDAGDMSYGTAAVNVGAKIRRFMGAGTGRSSPESHTGPVTLERQFFSGTTTPDGWTLGSVFSVNDGLVATGAGGWSTVAQYNPASRGISSLTVRKISASITIQSTDFVGGIGCDDSSAGAVAMIDMSAGTNGRLFLYFWNGSATGTVNFQADFAAALTNGRRYTLTVDRDLWTITAVLKDALTGDTVATATGDADGNTNSTRARFHGVPSIVHIQGTGRWDWVNFTKGAPGNVKAVVMGDSNYEGTVLSGGLSWVEQLNQNYSGRVVNASRGGDTSLGMVGRLEDLTDFSPRYAIMGMATNDTVLSDWRFNVQMFIDAARQIGAEPILMVPMPTDSKQAFITSVADDIYANFFGRLRYIDQLSPLTSSNNRVDWNATYKSDNLHANAAGQTKVLAQALLDVPELANG